MDMIRPTSAASTSRRATKSCHRPQGERPIDAREMAATSERFPWRWSGIGRGSKGEPVKSPKGARSNEMAEASIHCFRVPGMPARSRRSGSAGAPIAAHGTRSSRSGTGEAAARRRPPIATRSRAAVTAPRSSTRHQKSSTTHDLRPGSTNSTACWAAASCLARSY